MQNYYGRHDYVQADVLSNRTTSNGDNVEPVYAVDGVRRTINRFSDSGIDVTTEEDSLQLRISLQEKMNGVSPSNEAMKSVLALRETLRRLKRITDKAVVEFLVRSRDALQQQKQQHSDTEPEETSTNQNHDYKLVDLISTVLIHKREADKQMTEMESCQSEDPLSVLEKSLCYVLVDKALLNCLLLLDKAITEGKIVESDLDFKYDMASGKKIIVDFSEAILDRKHIALQDDIRTKDETIEEMRARIRALSSDKLRLENENKSLQEQSKIWMMKSEQLGMRNSVIDEERQLLKEKVCVLDESMAELQSCTEHLRQQLQTLELREEEVRKDNLLLKEKVQNLQEEHFVKDTEDRSSLDNKNVVDSGIVSFEGTSSSTPLKANDESHKEGLMSEENVTEMITRLTNDNKKLRTEVEQLETEDKILREQILTLKRTHSHEMHESREQICAADDQNKYLKEDLEGNSTEIILLKAQIIELQKINANVKTKMITIENELRFKDTEKTPDGSNIPEGNVCIGKGDSNVNKQFVSLNKAIRQKDVALQNINERLQEQEVRAQSMSVLLEELVKRNEMLVTKLEIGGAVTVVKNEFDVPDGYQEAIDGMLRSQSSTIEKGVVNMVTQVEKQGNEIKELEEQQKRMTNNAEAVETENVLLKVQVSDLTLTVEELEEDLIAIKSGAKVNSKRSGTPSGTTGHRVTFDSNVGLEKEDGKKLRSLIENAKGRCIVLERQIRYNTSVLKATQHRNEVLARDYEILEQHNCHLKKYLTEFHHANQVLNIKVSELDDRLKDVDEQNSLDEMEKQSLADRLKIMEGHTKYLKEEKDNLSKLVEVLRQKSSQPSEIQITATMDQRPEVRTKYSIIDKETDEVFNRNIGNKVDQLKNKIKQQAARSRILKCEVFEFLDDVRFLENELSCAVEQVKNPQSTLLIRSIFDGALVSTWNDEKSLCQQEGMGIIMSEIVEVFKSIMHRLISVSRDERGDVKEDPSDSLKLKLQLQEETVQLTAEKQQVQREVFALKAVFENILEQTDSFEAANKVREEQRCHKLRRQILSFVHKNSQMEAEILDHLKQQLALEDELSHLKESILNMDVEKDILLSLHQDFNLGAVKYCTESENKVMRDFCFVKQHGRGFEQHDAFPMQSDNDDVFSCPSDEGMYHSPTDREASSCDSGYHEGHSGVDKGDPGYHNRYLPTHTTHTGRQYLGSFYENTGKEEKERQKMVSATAERKPKGILKKSSPIMKRNVDTERGIGKIQVECEEQPKQEHQQGCKVCSITDIFKPFKRTTHNPDLEMYNKELTGL